MKTLRRRGPGDPERGMVTAETAMVLPFVVLVAIVLVWVVSLGVTHMRIADASAEAARLVARGESADAAREVAQSLVPGAKVQAVTSGGRVTVTIRHRSRLPLVPRARVDLRASTVAVIE